MAPIYCGAADSVSHAAAAGASVIRTNHRRQYQAVLVRCAININLIHRYCSDTIAQMSDFKTRVWLLPVHGPSANALESAPACRYRFPAEVVIDTMLQRRKTTKQMDELANPKVQGDVAAWSFGYQ